MSDNERKHKKVETILGYLIGCTLFFGFLTLNIRTVSNNPAVQKIIIILMLLFFGLSSGAAAIKCIYRRRIILEIKGRKNYDAMGLAFSLFMAIGMGFWCILLLLVFTAKLLELIMP